MSEELQQEQTYNLSLTLNQINNILTQLGKQKCQDVFGLVYAIHTQVGAQEAARKNGEASS